MKYFVSNLVVLIFATQILWGATSDVESAPGRPVAAARAVMRENPLRARTRPLAARIPFTLRVDAEEFDRVYRTMDQDDNPYQTFFGILFVNYRNGTIGSYPAELTRAIFKKQTIEHGFYRQFSSPAELTASSNLGAREYTWSDSRKAAHTAFKSRLVESFRDVPTNPYYQFVMAALKLRDEPRKAEQDLEVNAKELVIFGIRSLGNAQTKTALDDYHREITTIDNSEALSYLRQYHQRVYANRSDKNFVKFTFNVPKVLRTLEWDTYRMRLFNEFNGLIAMNLREKRKYHQKYFPDLKSTLWRAVAGAMTGIISSARPTVADVTSLVTTGYAWMTNSSELITNGTSYNETEAFNHHQQLTVPFDSQRATFMAVAATSGALVTVLGESLYNYLFCPPAFRLGDGDYVTAINLLSAYCTEQVVQNYGRDWGAVRSVLIAEKVADVILHDSIGFRKYIHHNAR